MGLPRTKQARFPDDSHIQSPSRISALPVPCRWCFGWTETGPSPNTRSIVFALAREKTIDLLFGLGPVSVHPEHQRQGIGSALIREGLSMCESSGNLACFVLGNPTYYQRFGFQNAYKAGFWYKKDEDNRAFQVIFWDNADQHLPRSEVRYGEAFNLTD